MIDQNFRLEMSLILAQLPIPKCIFISC